MCIFLGCAAKLGDELKIPYTAKDICIAKNFNRYAANLRASRKR
jgi:hypothetical protein